MLLSSRRTPSPGKQNSKWMGRDSREACTITCRAGFDLTWLKLRSSRKLQTWVDRTLLVYGLCKIYDNRKLLPGVIVCQLAESSDKCIFSWKQFLVGGRRKWCIILAVAFRVVPVIVAVLSFIYKNTDCVLVLLYKIVQNKNKVTIFFFLEKCGRTEKSL